VATKSKKNASYDLKAADRRRDLLVRVGLTAIVALVAVVLVGYIVLNGKSKPASGEAKAVRVASSKLVTNGDKQPKVVLGLYEDFLCPVCRGFEASFGPTIKQLIDSGAVAADYYMVAILDSSATKNYSTRASAAAYCVADEDTTPDKEVFSRFHAALYAQQPSETGTSFPDNKALIETARQAGAVGSVPDCINSGRYLPLAQGLAGATNVTGTPTIRINGEDFPISGPSGMAKPEDLVAKVKAVVGDLPGLTAVPANPAPPAPAPAP
jgi:protein-disulfide isomerase